MTENSKHGVAKLGDGVNQPGQSCPLSTGHSVYSITAMTPTTFSSKSVNAPQQGADIYNYGTEQS